MLDTISAPLAAKLHAPISWQDKDDHIQAFLARLQGNIVKGHGRSNVVYLFCRFGPGKETLARAFMRAQIARVRSAKDQLDCADRKRRMSVKDDRPLVCVFLSKAGYDYFGVPHGKQPANPAFQAGMGAAKLGDPPQAHWDSHLRAPHAMILIAVGSPEAAQTESTNLLNDMGQIGDVGTGQSGEIIGNQFFNTKGEGVENFGYVDGRSQPLVLQEDIDAGGDRELPDVGFPVDQFVVPDPGAADSAAYGSYFVFRQLEQDVRGFTHREDLLVADHKDFPNRDSAGVGRLESGTPFELTDDDGDHPNITNNFTFTSDPPRCPHFAHIRKVNPRTDESRGMIMIRRGITYGTRADAHPDPADPTRMVLEADPAPDKIPSRGVGLLFQSYQANITRQFEATQVAANSPDKGGVDPVIGQTRSALLDWPREYGSAVTDPVDFYSRDGKKPPEGPYVKLLGGGYFFAPSLPFLHSL